MSAFVNSLLTSQSSSAAAAPCSASLLGLHCLSCSLSSLTASYLWFCPIVPRTRGACPTSSWRRSSSLFARHVLGTLFVSGALFGLEHLCSKRQCRKASCLWRYCSRQAMAEAAQQQRVICECGAFCDAPRFYKGLLPFFVSLYPGAASFFIQVHHGSSVPVIACSRSSVRSARARSRRRSRGRLHHCLHWLVREPSSDNSCDYRCALWLRSVRCAPLSTDFRSCSVRHCFCTFCVFLPRVSHARASQLSGSAIGFSLSLSPSIVTTSAACMLSFRCPFAHAAAHAVVALTQPIRCCCNCTCVIVASPERSLGSANRLKH